MQDRIAVEEERSFIYLDPDLYVTDKDSKLKKFLAVYECQICHGVALDPIECKSSKCNSICCQKCIHKD
jgi:hypothetical protein